MNHANAHPSTAGFNYKCPSNIVNPHYTLAFLSSPSYPKKIYKCAEHKLKLLTSILRSIINYKVRTKYILNSPTFIYHGLGFLFIRRGISNHTQIYEFLVKIQLENM